MDKIKKQIGKILAKELKGKLKGEEILKLIEIPPSDHMGDYSFPCFSLAKIEKKNPILIAENLKKKVKLPTEISNSETSSGYLNFFIEKKNFVSNVFKNIKKIKPSVKKKKIILEHTSVNPNASPHVGRMRNSFIGDSLNRILEFQGYNVETHYYVNDVSKQIAMLALTFKSTDKFSDLLKNYVSISQKIKKNPKLEKEVFDLLYKFEKGDKKTKDLFKTIVDIAVSGQKKIFSDLGIKFDFFDYESNYIQASKKVLNELQKTGKLFEDENSRLVLNQENTGVERSMKSPVLVLTRKDKTGLYPLRDIAYTIYKCKRGENILVLGEDQKLYFEQIKQALILLKKPYPNVVHYSFVLLKDIGKMATRKGDVVLLEDFLKQAIKKAEKEIEKRGTKGDAKKVALAAVKYAILKNQNNQNITFDLEQALAFEGNTGPYLLYSYARASSILRKSKFKSNKSIKILDLKEQEIKLLKKMNMFQETIENAHSHFSPNLIANYSYELAQIFNEFYHTCPVIGSAEQEFRLKLIDNFRKIMKYSLNLLGIEVLEEM